MQRGPEAMLLRPTNVDLPECDCHHPPMESDGRRSRPVEHHLIADLKDRVHPALVQHGLAFLLSGVQ